MYDLWLKHVRQEGLVVAKSALDDQNLIPISQNADDTELFKHLAEDLAKDTAVFWQLAEKVLEWPSNRVALGDDLPSEATCRLTEIGVTLQADAALIVAKEQLPQLLVKRLEADEHPDARTSFGRWTGVTEQEAFERLLRETGVEQGLLVSGEVLRLTYAPKNETPGFLEWPIAGMATNDGRDMLAGLKLVLGRNAIWGNEEASLRGILRRSRKNQNIVSSKLADQVLGALYSLLRGFTSQSDTDHGLRQVAEKDPKDFYEGLLTVLMRLVFILYAEDRNLLPSSDADEAREIYEQGYAVRRLFSDLEADAALYPDTMADRYGAWGRLVGLFHLIHAGANLGDELEDFMHERRGKLFDPNSFPFLLGQFNEGEIPCVLPISDKCIYEVLTQLLILDGERLSYKTLDVEQIGSVYEIVMGFTVTQAKASSVSLRSQKAKVPVYVDLETLLNIKPSDRKKHLKDQFDVEVSDGLNKELKRASTVEALLSALDKKIDERGSPAKRLTPSGAIILQPTDERRSSGSHYTPRSLTAPVVRQALEPLFQQLGEAPTPDQLLDMKVCDPAMGSGAFLVEACRAIGEQLEQAWANHPKLLPDEARADPQTFARREVSKRCLYGVDKNHMATDLAKLSLWLVTLAKNEDFSFLDHALKTGDSLVGLSLDQISAVSWEGDERPLLASEFVKHLHAARENRRRIRSAPDNVTFEQQLHRLQEAEKDLEQVRLVGDAVVAIFFSEAKPKTRKEALGAFQDRLNHQDGWSFATRLSDGIRQSQHPIQPFHWQVEFPEVFEGDHAGFHSFIGNPPFAGKNTITAANRSGFLDWLKVVSPSAHGNADLAAHFFRRAFTLLREQGTLGFIATNTIGQGDTRESGLRYMIKEQQAQIYRAERRVKWPGEAAVVVSTVHMSKGQLTNTPVKLDGRDVSRISAFVREGDYDDTPEVLEENEGQAFIGSYILGMGFTFDDENAAKGKATSLAEMERLIAKDPRNAERIKPYLGGSEVNTDPEHKHHRYVIDFEDFPLRRDDDLKAWGQASSKEKTQMQQKGVVPADYKNPVAADWPDLLEIVETMVKPERNKVTDKIGKRIWWRFLRRREELLAARQGKENVFALSRVSGNLAIAEVTNDTVFADSCVVFTDQTASVLFSSVHEIWARLLSSSMKDDLRYSPSDCFQNFPSPADIERNNYLNSAFSKYLETRAKILQDTNQGLTTTYNRFHDPLDRKPDIVELRRLHAQLDDAVLRAYGWEDLADLAADTSDSGAAPRFLHGTDEPEFAYQKRLHWPAWFRDKVLARLLALNKERASAGAVSASNQKMLPKALQLEQKGSLL